VVSAAGSGGPGASFDVGAVFELGSAWGVMGDVLSAHAAGLGDALAGVSWEGPAQVQFMVLFEQVLGFVERLPDQAWQVGAAINAYGEAAEAAEARYAAEQHASFIQDIIAMVLGIVGVLGLVAGPLLGPLLGLLVAPLTTLVSLASGLAELPAGVAAALEIGAGIADTAAQVAWTTAVEDRELGAPYSFPGINW
jgi:hypothetical protein